MKILLINPPDKNTIVADNPPFIDEERGVNPPLGLLYIAAYLRQNSSHEIEILDTLVEGIGYDKLPDIIRQKSPDVVGITAMTFTLVDVMQTAKIVKSISDQIKIVLGGPHASIYPRETASLKEIDFVIAGEGEKLFLELINNINNYKYLASLKGLYFKYKGLVSGDGQTDFIKDLDSLPFPARDLVPYKKYTSILSLRNPVTTMFTSRGCPFNCNFCYRPHMGREFRARSAINVVDEIETSKSMGIEEFFIYDDTFTIDRKRVLAICDEIIARHLNIVWDIRARVDTIDEEMIKKLKKANCVRIHYGVEAGTEKILQVLNKGITLKDAEDAFKLTRKYGIATLAYFMIGSPTETKDDILETISFAKKLNPDYVNVTITTPFPATNLYKMALTEGLYEKDYWREFAINPSGRVVSRYWGKELSKEELFALLDKFYKDFYSQPSYILKQILEIRSFKDFRNKVKIGLKILG